MAETERENIRKATLESVSESGALYAASELGAVRAAFGSYTTSLRARINVRCRSAVRVKEYTGSTSAGNRRSRRMWSTTIAGTFSKSGKWPSRLNALSSTIPANR